jgi:crossover junction endodeoxyribonuclease RuvC
MAQRFLGIDPGLSGAVAVVSTSGNPATAVEIADMPVIRPAKGKGKARVDAVQLAAVLRAMAPTCAIIELVGSRPGEGHAGAFSFGKSAGIVEGVIAALGIPYTLVTPATWKGALRCPADKELARARASQLLPGAAHHWPLKKHDGRAEAAMLAHYASVVEGKSISVDW